MLSSIPLLLLFGALPVLVSSLWSQGNNKEASFVNSADSCPSRGDAPVSDALDLVTRNYLTSPWLEGGVMILYDSEWTTISTTLGVFSDPNVFISLPKLFGTVSNVGYQAVPRVKEVTTSGEGFVSFQTRLYQANDSYCSNEWRVPLPIDPVTVTWMVIETGAYNISGRVFFVNNGPITREDYDPSNSNNFVRFDHPTGCEEAPTAICAFPAGTETGAIAQIQTLVYDRHLFVRAFVVQLRFARFVLQPHDSNDLSYYEMPLPETLSFMTFEVGQSLSCLEDWGLETKQFIDVTSEQKIVNHGYAYREIPGKFGIVGTVNSLSDSTTVRVYEESKTSFSFMLQEDQCTDLETEHTTAEDVYTLTMGRISVGSSCVICQVLFTPYVPTSLPTSAPSLQPTLNSGITLSPTSGAVREEYIGDAETDLLNIVANNSNAFSLSYEESLWGSTQRFGGAEEWSLFLYLINQREGLFKSTQVSVYVIGADCANCPNGTIDHGEYEVTLTCTDEDSSNALLSSLYGMNAVSITCEGHVWQTELCSDNAMHLCIDCISPCGCSSESAGSYLFPADAACRSPSGGSAQSLLIDYIEAHPAPSFGGVDPLTETYNAESKRMNVNVYDLSGAGYMYCAAVSPSKVLELSSLSEISNWSPKYFFNSSVQTNVTISVHDVLIGMNYDAICYSESLIGSSITSLSDARSRLDEFVISEQKTVFLSFDSYYLPASSEENPVFRVHLNAAPSAHLKLTPVVRHTPTRPGGECSLEIGDYSVLGSDVTIPSALNFTAQSVAFEDVAFYLDTTLEEGCFFITLDFSGKSANEFSTRIVVDSPISISNHIGIDVYESDGAPSAPSLQSAVFSTSGTSLFVKFTAETDRGGASDIQWTSFSCDVMFTFSGASASSCSFISDREVVASFPSSGSTSSLVTVGSPLSLKVNAVKASCLSSTGCSSYPFNGASSVHVEVPSPNSTADRVVILYPEVVLSSPVEVSTCEEVMLSYAASQGRAGRDWSSIVWSIESEDGIPASSATSAMNANADISKSHQALDTALLGEGLFVVMLKLKNFLGSTGHDSVTIRVHGNSSKSPVVLIAGVSDGEVIAPGKELRLKGHVTASSCAPAHSAFSYTWNVYKNEKLSAVANAAVEPVNYFVPSYALEVDSKYQFELLVKDAISGAYSSSRVSVVVKSGGVNAVISNGDQVEVSSEDRLKLDASSSINHDGKSHPLSFSWRCVEMSSGSTGCDSLISATSADKAVIAANSLTKGVTYTFSVHVANDVGGTDKAEIKVVVSMTASSDSSGFASSSIRLISPEDAAYDRLVSAENELTASAIVSVSGKTRLTWYCQLNGNSSFAKLKTVVYDADSPLSFDFPLRIPPGYFFPEATYSLVLRADPYDCPSSCFSSSSEISFRVNSSPRIGALDITPSTGVSGCDGDSFTLTLDSCVDDDIPLKYSFSYALDTQDGAVLLTDFSSLSLWRTFLPVGGVLPSPSTSNNYPLEIIGAVTDSLGGYADKRVEVITQSPFGSITDTNALVAALEESVTSGVSAALSAQDYSLLATHVGIGNSLIENALGLAYSKSSLNAATVESSAALLTMDLLTNITSNLDNMDFFFANDVTLFQSAVEICQNFADSDVIQTLNRTDVIEAANTYASSLDALFANSEAKSLGLSTDLLACFDSILFAVDKLPQTQGSRRMLLSASENNVANSTLTLMFRLKDLMYFGEVSSETLQSLSYYVEVGYPFELSPSSQSSGIFPSADKSASTADTGTADFTEAISEFDLMVATKYAAELFSLNGLSSATCQFDLEPCDLIGSFDTSRQVFTLTTSESVPTTQNVSVVSELPLSRDVEDSLTPDGASTPYAISCPVISTNRTVVVFYTCDEEDTLGLVETVSVECSSSVQGEWGGECPLYPTEVICGDERGDYESRYACRAVSTESSSTACSCISSPSLRSEDGKQVYSFELSSSPVLGKSREAAQSTPSPLGDSSSNSGEDVVFVVLFIVAGLILICIIYLIVFCIFRRVAERKDENEEYHEKIDDAERLEMEMQKLKENEVKTTAQIQFSHNMTHAQQSAEQQYFRTAKSHYEHAIQVAKDEKASGNSTIESKALAQAYFEYADVLEKLGETDESVAMYKKAYVLDTGLSKVKSSEDKPKTLGQLKRQLSAALEDVDLEQGEEEDDAIFTAEVPPPRDQNGHVWRSKFCEKNSFCQICNAYITGDTEKEQMAFQCTHCSIFGHRDCLLVDVPPCEADTATDTSAGFLGTASSLASRAKGMLSIGRSGSGKFGANKTNETGYNNLVGRQNSAPFREEDEASYHSDDDDNQPDMTNLYQDDSNDVSYMTMERQVDERGRKSLAIQSTKFSNPNPKPKGILKTSKWTETDAYQPESRSESPPRPLSARVDSLLMRQNSNKSDVDTATPAPQTSRLQSSRKAKKTDVPEHQTTYEMINHTTESFNI